MICFEVSLNGKVACRVGLEKPSTTVVSLSLTSGGRAEAEGSSGLYFHVGGLKSGQHFQWQTPEPQVGDEIRIRIAESEVSDPGTPVTAGED